MKRNFVYMPSFGRKELRPCKHKLKRFYYYLYVYVYVCSLVIINFICTIHNERVYEVDQWSKHKTCKFRNIFFIIFKRKHLVDYINTMILLLKHSFKINLSLFNYNLIMTNFSSKNQHDNRFGKKAHTTKKPMLNLKPSP